MGKTYKDKKSRQDFKALNRKKKEKKDKEKQAPDYKRVEAYYNK